MKELLRRFEKIKTRIMDVTREIAAGDRLMEDIRAAKARGLGGIDIGDPAQLDNVTRYKTLADVLPLKRAQLLESRGGILHGELGQWVNDAKREIKKAADEEAQMYVVQIKAALKPFCRPVYARTLNTETVQWDEAEQFAVKTSIYSAIFDVSRIDCGDLNNEFWRRSGGHEDAFDSEWLANGEAIMAIARKFIESGNRFVPKGHFAN